MKRLSGQKQLHAQIMFLFLYMSEHLGSLYGVKQEAPCKMHLVTLASQNKPCKIFMIFATLVATHLIHTVPCFLKEQLMPALLPLI